MRAAGRRDKHATRVRELAVQLQALYRQVSQVHSGEADAWCMRAFGLSRRQLNDWLILDGDLRTSSVNRIASSERLDALERSLVAAGGAIQQAARY